MLSIHCNKCEQLLGSSYLFCFLDNNSNANSRFTELTSRSNEETLVTLLAKLVTAVLDPHEFLCKKCLSLICSIHDDRILHFNNAANVYFRELVYGKNNFPFKSLTIYTQLLYLD
jgi:hypothetical protein